MRWEYQERFPRDRGSTIPICITVSFEVGGGENVPCIPAHAQPPMYVSG